MFKSLFSSNKTPADLSFLSVDMHSHLLPGLDDGLQTIDQSLSFIQQLQDLGYKKLICTPHIFFEMYPNSSETILPKLDLVRNAISKAGIDIQLEAAAEYMIDLEFEKLMDSGEQLLTFGEKKHILVEMSYLAPYPNFEKIIFNLQMKGLKPIFAHPERYAYLHNQPVKYERLIELGCDLQVNLLSLSGFYGKEVKKAAEVLFKKKMVSFLATDMHHERHMELLKELVQQKDFFSTVASAELLNKTLLT
jgi:tyrosine-protein phosphatase YwqE